MPVPVKAGAERSDVTFRPERRMTWAMKWLDYQRIRHGLTATVPVLLLAVFGGSAWADLRFTQPAADVGEVRTGTPLVHRFALVNAGPEVVEITEARASCGCLTPRLDKRTFQPGEEGALQLEVNTLSQSAGPHTWRVQVACQSGGTRSDVTLCLTARVIAEVTVQPAALTMFADRPLAHDVVLTDLRAHPLAVTEVRTSCPALTARIDAEAAGVPAPRRWKVRVEVGDEFPQGRHAEVLSIYTDDPGYRELKVPVVVIKQAARHLAASPNQVTLLAPPGQAVPSRILLIRDPNNRPIDIEAVAADDPAVLSQWAQGPGNMATVKVTVDRARVAGGSLQSALHIHVRAPYRETLTIPVHCTLP